MNRRTDAQYLAFLESLPPAEVRSAPTKTEFFKGDKPTTQRPPLASLNVSVSVYRHPDGDGDIRFDAETSRLFLLNESEGLSAFAVIGPLGLRDVAEELLALAAKLEVKQ